MVVLIVEVDVEWLCRGCRSFTAHRVELNRSDELRKFGHGPGAIVMQLKTIGRGQGSNSCKPNPYLIMVK